MMNSNFDISNLTTQQQLSLPSHIVGAPNETTTSLSTYYHAEQHQTPHHQHYSQPMYNDPRHFTLTSNTTTGLEKSSYISAVSPSLSNMNTGARFFATTTTGSSTNSTATGQSNTILITNNFADQNSLANSTNVQTGNIRFVTGATATPTENTLQSTSTENLRITASTNLIPNGNALPSAQHTVYNINNSNLNKDVQHLLSAHILQQSQMQPQLSSQLHEQQQQRQNFPSAVAASELITHQYGGTSDVAAFGRTQPVSTSVMPHGYYVTPEPTQNSTNITSSIAEKLLNNVSPDNSHIPTICVDGKSPIISGNITTNVTSGSTVVLDHINICINNLYTDTICTPTNSLTSRSVQQPSPIIPAIQHKAIIDSTVPNDDSIESNILVIDEPDSTTTATTPHTPPITPEAISFTTGIGVFNNGAYNGSSLNNGNITTTTNSSNSSPCTSSADKTTENITSAPLMLETVPTKVKNQQSDAENGKNKITAYPSSLSRSSSSPPKETKVVSIRLTNIRTPSKQSIPSSPLSPKCLNFTQNKKSKNDSLTKDAVPPVPTFTIGEDVLIKRKDSCFYLGTIMEYTLPKYRVCFDDHTEAWYLPDEMRKLSINTSLSSPPPSSSSSSILSMKLPNNHSPICVACKLTIPEAKIEVCERCGRGYHRKCTRETEHGNGIWLCKRCGKCMKLCNNNDNSDNNKFYNIGCCLQFPYNENALSWDKKHQVNKEQIYCYCGKMGNYEQNMLQCCRCLNWFHVKCTHSYTDDKLYRGDRFFVFSCSVCNQGPEFFKRLQMNWIDLVHLILYNLSFTNYHQKYHHIDKDILPYAIKIRSALPIPQKWICMPSQEFKENILHTLNRHKERFKNSRCEIGNRDIFYGLRCVQPPIIPAIHVRRSDILNDTFLKEILNLTVLEKLPSPPPSSPPSIDPVLMMSKSTSTLTSMSTSSSPSTSMSMSTPLSLSSLSHKRKMKKLKQTNLKKKLNAAEEKTSITNVSNTHDVYEFRADDDDDDNDDNDDGNDIDVDVDDDDDVDDVGVDDDDADVDDDVDDVGVDADGDCENVESAIVKGNNDSSEDEIPIKHIMEKVKKSLEKMDAEDDNANDALLTVTQEKLEPERQSSSIELKQQQDRQEEEETAQTSDMLVEEKSSSETVTSNEYDDQRHQNEHHQNQVKCDNNMKLLANMPMKSRRKRKAFTMLHKAYDSVAHRALMDISSSDETSNSSSPGTSLDLIIPPPKNFLGPNNPFRMITMPSKTKAEQPPTSTLSSKLNDFYRPTNVTVCNSGNLNATTTTTTTTNATFNTKLAALRSAGIFSNLSASNLVKAAGQPRTLRTIKRQLSAKDITIGPNKEIKRKRTRRLSSNVEVISTTTLTPNLFPIHAKDMLAGVTGNVQTAGPLFMQQQANSQQDANKMKRVKIIGNAIPTKIQENITLLNNNNNNNNNNTNTNTNTNSNNNNSDNFTLKSDSNYNQDGDKKEKRPLEINIQPKQHGRLLRQRPQKISPNTSRRSSVSSNSSSTCTGGIIGQITTSTSNATMNDGGVMAKSLSSSLSSLATTKTLTTTATTTTIATTAAPSSSPSSSSAKCNLSTGLKSTVNKYFGVVNRIESGEKFSIRAKRVLPNGQEHYLIEWAEPTPLSLPLSKCTSKTPASTSVDPNEKVQETKCNQRSVNDNNNDTNYDHDQKDTEIENTIVQRAKTPSPPSPQSPPTTTATASYTITSNTVKETTGSIADTSTNLIPNNKNENLTNASKVELPDVYSSS